MSSGSHAEHGDHGHGDHGHSDHHDDGHAHGSMKDYVTGFILSVILTAIPFWLVMTDALANDQMTGMVIMAFAVVQIVVHMIYFLHMNSRSEGGWTMMALIFTIILVVITMTGSLWVMYHLNTNMMPMSHDMSQMP
ncbi:cytochrome bo3 quinol oxidase subunit 4 [Sphingomonas laterariae]|uniref:Cytochrome bo(3) ubiquinol oxidase subunit 4 n=1 Tax=Edaphosphingomonas laterariae TaxID=861865 RepID=A0A239CCB5_9SPHN|nr:cytochrome o ubiquinol oxidase subunit IV [Sphingomonas laterariae]SNS17865.1 cytochrome bo3 quinol oxidase subunit 4 [Sphingomonas laterariae]